MMTKVNVHERFVVMVEEMELAINQATDTMMVSKMIVIAVHFFLLTPHKANVKTGAARIPATSRYHEATAKRVH